MKGLSARILIRSLLERLREEGRVFVLPEGRLSVSELQALNYLSKVLDDTSVTDDDTSVTDNATHLPVGDGNKQNLDASQTGFVEPVELNRTAASAHGPDETDMRLCIDFGTAMSKAWAAYETIDGTIPLNLGATAGDGNEFPVASTIFIANSGRLFFGGKAELQHRQEIQTGRQRFDNIKRILSDAEIGQDINEIPVDDTIDPTKSGVTKGELLILYLGWITDLALIALHKIAEEDMEKADSSDLMVLRSIRRRFAIPCFESAIDEKSDGMSRSLWAQKILRQAMLKAQIVADTLSDKWDTLRLEDVLPILRSVQQVNLENFDHLLMVNPAVREPIAAGASRFSDKFGDEDYRSTRYLLVVDAGAGTTDFAVFQAVIDPEQGDERFKFALISPTVTMSRIAGNEIDAVLRPLFLTAVGLNPVTGAPRSEKEFSFIRSILDSDIRDLKRILFSNGYVEFSFLANLRGNLSIEEVLEDPSYLKLGEELLVIRNGIIFNLFQENVEFIERIRRLNGTTGKPIQIQVLLTGGSSLVPIFSDLSEGSLIVNGAKFAFSKMGELPRWIDGLEQDVRDELANSYPQCAVAIGGTAPLLPTELNDLVAPVTPGPEGRMTLERFQTQGV